LWRAFPAHFGPNRCIAGPSRAVCRRSSLRVWRRSVAIETVRSTPRDSRAGPAGHPGYNLQSIELAAEILEETYLTCYGEVTGYLILICKETDPVTVSRLRTIERKPGPLLSLYNSERNTVRELVANFSLHGQLNNSALPNSPLRAGLFFRLEGPETDCRAFFSGMTTAISSGVARCCI
jgi:hypothetical protein